MAYCVHHIPGRARFKIPQLGRNPALAVDIEEKVSTIEGVLHVEINVHARSMVVHYDIDVNPLDGVIEHITETKTADRPTEAGTTRVPPAHKVNKASKKAAGEEVPRMVGRVFGQAVFATLVQRALERSLLSILTGLR